MTAVLRASLIAIVLISVSAAGFFLIALSTATLRDSLHERNRALAASVANEVRIFLDGYQNALEILAHLPARGSAEAEAVAVSSPAFQSVIYADSEGRVRAVSADSGLRDFDVSRRAFFAVPSRTRASYLSDSEMSADGYEPSVALSVPVDEALGGGVVVGFIGLATLTDYVKGLAKRPDDMVAVADGTGTFVAHSDIERVRRRENLFSLPGLGMAPESDDRTARIDGRDYLLNRDYIPKNGWTVVVAQPLERLIVPARESGLVVVAIAFGAILASSLAIARLLGLAERDIAALVDRTRAIASGDYAHRLDYEGYKDFNALADNFRVMADSVGGRELALHDARGLALANLGEKEVLIREIHHRVKNNLQLVISLLSLQAGSETGADPEAIYEESINRVRAMAMIHEMLYQSESLARIDFAEYVKSLVESLLYLGPSGSIEIRLDLELDPIELDIDTAIPCGLLINEALTNSLKYGCLGPEPRVRVHMKCRGDGSVRLELGDTGPGIPPSVLPETTQSLGLRLIFSLAKQLKGNLELSREGGTTWTMTFPAPTAMVDTGGSPRG